ncbi:carboxypeptidase S [Suhomyces tanzawaensis NRRL Y-17324]|uniref:Carboxypeptidase S n=1 Tax=Suhomyces tanzawaensis NRRL Y-17324 TaxID=984487 RepID=A0A1E4SLV1_9ASCO|nr:carboxypeptidase S [Suhomyces tanzawaensis NRRL Y-17324]ODV80490.1 carboxypeptidase S [Suhomyces tanzawaensis NRRL Y-17324]
MAVTTRIGYATGLDSYLYQKPQNPDSLCPLVQKLDPHEYIYGTDTIDTILHDKSFREKSKQKLLGAIRIPSESFDEMVDPGTTDSLDELYKLEPVWEQFEKLHQYLEKTFPLLHKHLKLEKVNKFGLVYTWQGSSDKKPILLTAHQDVVPVQEATVGDWKFPPYEGGEDGKFLYGRGVSDCKNLLTGLLETVELLLEEGKFVPERTIILGFGYDEESQGKGAGYISKHLEARYGPDSFLQIIDEGSSGYKEFEGLKFILPATAEKGALNAVIGLYTPGGHSSIPPEHTSIGILAQLINEIEAVQFESILTNANPVLNTLQCVAEHSKSVDKTLKKNILKAHFDQNANKKVIEYWTKNPGDKYLITTSQAVDIIQGGVKSNALPEYAEVLINSRIAVEESVDSTSSKLLDQVQKIAKKFDLGVVFEGQEVVKPTEKGHFDFTLPQTLEPAPITPINDELWSVFGGSLRYLYEELLLPNENSTFVLAPFLSTGNTDTKSYWDLTRSIYRYQPGLPTPNSNIHSVNERLNFDGHLGIVAFYYYYLQVVDKIEDSKFGH